jgi:hypothetical protein
VSWTWKCDSCNFGENSATATHCEICTARKDSDDEDDPWADDNDDDNGGGGGVGGDEYGQPPQPLQDQQQQQQQEEEMGAVLPARSGTGRVQVITKPDPARGIPAGLLTCDAVIVTVSLGALRCSPSAR